MELELLELDLTTSEQDGANELRGNVGDAVTNDGWGQGVGIWAPEGFSGVPNEPSSDGAARVLVLRDGNQSYGIGFKDNRNVGRYAARDPGDRCIVTDAECRFLMARETQSITLYTKGSTGDPQLIQLGGTANDAIILDVGGPNGTAHLEMKSGEVNITAGGKACIQIKGDQVNIFGEICWIAAGRTAIGQVAGAPPPIGANSAVVGPSGMTGIPSTSCTIA